ncbi:MAG: hypothetical protein IPI49_29275 [Myxococcales bacterium]|nr:hypothetical protein [Myxococcales bacterium]
MSVARGFNVKELSADKAYLSNDNLTAVEAVGAVPYVPFKANSRGTGKSDAWRRLWHIGLLDLSKVAREDGGRWQTVARALPIASSSLVQTMSGRVDVSVTIAFRVAKLLDAPLHRVLAGEALPPGTCKHCGRPN